MAFKHGFPSLSVYMLTNRKSSKASTTLSLDLCPDFMGIVVGQASFLIHIVQNFSAILEGISGEN